MEAFLGLLRFKHIRGILGLLKFNKGAVILDDAKVADTKGNLCSRQDPMSNDAVILDDAKVADTKGNLCSRRLTPERFDSTIRRLVQYGAPRAAYLP